MSLTETKLITADELLAMGEIRVADPLKMTITIHRTGTDPAVFLREQELRDEAALPGFVLPLQKVFTRS